MSDDDFQSIVSKPRRKSFLNFKSSTKRHKSAKADAENRAVPPISTPQRTTPSQHASPAVPAAPPSPPSPALAPSELETGYRQAVPAEPCPICQLPFPDICRSDNQRAAHVNECLDRVTAAEGPIQFGVSIGKGCKASVDCSIVDLTDDTDCTDDKLSIAACTASNEPDEDVDQTCADPCTIVQQDPVSHAMPSPSANVDEEPNATLGSTYCTLSGMADARHGKEADAKTIEVRPVNTAARGMPMAAGMPVTRDMRAAGGMPLAGGMPAVGGFPTANTSTAAHGSAGRIGRSSHPDEIEISVTRFKGRTVD